MHKKAAMLEDRGVISVSGEDATSFLQGLLTNDVERLGPSEARYGALLTPQGKILFDMIVVRAASSEAPSYLIDCTATQAADLAKRLGFYKLRAKVAVADVSADRAVAAFWGDESPECRRRPSLRRPARSTLGLARDPAAADCRRDRIRARGRIRRPSHRGRGAQGRPRFRLCGRLPARRQFRSSPWGRFRQGLLRRPGGRFAHEASRNRAQARCASQTGWTRPSTWHAGHGPRARSGRAWLLLGTRSARASEARPRRGGDGGWPHFVRGRSGRRVGGVIGGDRPPAGRGFGPASWRSCAV